MVSPTSDKLFLAHLPLDIVRQILPKVDDLHSARLISHDWNACVADYKERGVKPIEIVYIFMGDADSLLIYVALREGMKNHLAVQSWNRTDQPGRNVRRISHGEFRLSAQRELSLIYEIGVCLKFLVVLGLSILPVIVLYVVGFEEPTEATVRKSLTKFFASISEIDKLELSNVTLYSFDILCECLGTVQIRRMEIKKSDQSMAALRIKEDDVIKLAEKHGVTNGLVLNGSTLKICT